MSSPIAKNAKEKKIWHNAIVYVHQKLAHSRRIDILSQTLIRYFNGIIGDKKNIRCIDVGCGDLGIKERIAEKVPGTVWQYLDIYDLPKNLANNEKWKGYIKFNGKDLPFDDDSIDIVLFCDMLHHAADNVDNLLREAHRVGKYIIIKDSFEYSLYSRYMLRLMDIVGNWGYGVHIPKKYFTVDEFRNICAEMKFNIKVFDVGIQIYGHLPIIRNVLRPEWQFIAVLEKDK